MWADAQRDGRSGKYKVASSDQGRKGCLTPTAGVPYRKIDRRRNHRAKI